MNKLRNTAIATGLFVAGTFGAIEADSAMTHSTSQEKIECYQYPADQAKACAAEIDNNNQSNELGIGILEVGLLAGAAFSGYEYFQTLRRTR